MGTGKEEPDPEQGTAFALHLLPLRPSPPPSHLGHVTQPFYTTRGASLHGQSQVGA